MPNPKPVNPQAPDAGTGQWINDTVSSGLSSGLGLLGGGIKSSVNAMGAVASAPGKLAAGVAGNLFGGSSAGKAKQPGAVGAGAMKSAANATKFLTPGMTTINGVTGYPKKGGPGVGVESLSTTRGGQNLGTSSNPFGGGAPKGQVHAGMKPGSGTAKIRPLGGSSLARQAK